MVEINDENVLRQEIIESQRSQAEFLKWKLIAVAAIGGLALSYSGVDDPKKSFWSGLDQRFLLCLIPIICAYVDLISIHLMLRIVVIGTYLRKTKELLPNQETKDYESFLCDIRKLKDGHPFMLELHALHGSSILISLLVLVFGLIIFFTNPEGWAFVVSGLGGMVFTIVLMHDFTNRVNRIAEMSILRQGVKVEV